MFEKEHLRVNKILDYSSTYGVVMGKEARKLRRCFKEFTERAFANEIANHIQTNTVQLKVNIICFVLLMLPAECLMCSQTDYVYFVLDNLSTDRPSNLSIY